MKKQGLQNIESLTLGDFYRSYSTIAPQKEIVAIKRNRIVDGYYVPAEVYEALLRNSAEEKP